MDMNNVNIEEIVKQVLSGMTGTAPAAAQTAAPAAAAAVAAVARERARGDDAGALRRLSAGG